MYIAICNFCYTELGELKKIQVIDNKVICKTHGEITEADIIKIALEPEPV